MLINSFGRDFAPYNTFSATLRTELATMHSAPLELLEISLSLESARSGNAAQEALLVDYLAAYSPNRRFDLVVPIGGPAVRFSARHRQKLFSDTPLLFAGVDDRHIQQDLLTPGDAVLAYRIEPKRVAETVLQVLPETKKIAVVIGTSPLEKFWSEQIRADFEPYADRLAFEWLDHLSFDEMLERCAKLPARTAIFYAFLAVDAKGIPHGDERVLTRLHGAANAPMFGIFESLLGRGIVGGSLADMVEMSHRTAQAANRILNGESAGAIRPVSMEMGTPQFDWRELRRWRIAVGRLPPDSVVRFRVPTSWERHWHWICGGLLFLVLQALLIVGLLINRRKRRRGEIAEKLTAELSSRFVNLPADQVDAAIQAAQRQICEQLGFDISTLWQWSLEHSGDLLLTHACRLGDGPPIPLRMSAAQQFPWCLKEIQSKRRIRFQSLEQLPPEAKPDVESARMLQIKSNVTIPLATGDGSTLGAISFGTIGRHRAWRDQVLERLEIVAQIFANALARKRAELNLRETESRLDLAADAAAAGMWRLDLATRCFWLTDRTRDLFEFGPDEVVTLDRFLDRVHPDDRNAVQCKVTELVESMAAGQVEYRVHFNDGRIKWMRSQGRVRASTPNRPDSLMGVTLDITANKSAEEALRNFSARLISSQESERARLARELHDDITQRLACLAIDVGQSGLGGLGKSREETGRSVREELIRLGEDVHALSCRLHPSILYDLGLPAALRVEAERFERQGLGVIGLTFHGVPESLPSDASLCLFRIAQEALRNAARHASARTITLSLVGFDGGLQLVVQDDGCGFDPAAKADHPSLGLESMRERVRLLDGEFEVESAPNEGTTILAWVPVKITAPAAAESPNASLESSGEPR